MRRTVIALAALGALGSAAAAQTTTLPSTSRGEATASGINQSLSVQQQNRAAAQQNQFELNALRNDLSRPVVPSVVAPVAPGGPSGQIIR